STQRGRPIVFATSRAQSRNSSTVLLRVRLRKVIIATGSVGIGNRSGNIFNPIVPALIFRNDAGTRATKGPLWLRKLRHCPDTGLTATRGRGSPCARNASNNAFSDVAPEKGVIHEASTRSAKLSFRHRVHRLRGLAARHHSSSNRCSTFKSSRRLSSKGRDRI